MSNVRCKSWSPIKENNKVNGGIPLISLTQDSLEHILKADPEDALVPVSAGRRERSPQGVGPARAVGGPRAPPRVVSPGVPQAKQAQRGAVASYLHHV